MHRFIPLTARQRGYRVVEMAVHHRPRAAGRTKYGIGNRAIPGLMDCLAVRWMRSRRVDQSYEEVGTPAGTGPASSAPLREKART